MANISYMRAGASCLPFVGSWVALYNALEVKAEMPSRTIETLIGIQTLVINSQRILPTLASFPKGNAEGNADGIRDAQQALEAQRTELRNKYLPAREKGRVYAICGIVGNVLSVALLVGLTALGILSGAYPLIWGAYFTFQAIVLGCNLYQHNKVIKELSKPPSFYDMPLRLAEPPSFFDI